jgi:ABC-type transporter Mla subunit MlaD
MRRRPRATSLAGQPVLVGAVTVLVIVIATLVAYHANQGLPFVATYDVRMPLADATGLRPGSDVRSGGVLVGRVQALWPRRRSDGTMGAEAELALDTDLRPLPAGTTAAPRGRSALGTQYLELRPRRPADGGEVVQLDKALSTFDARTRRGLRRFLSGAGGALAARGPDLAITLRRLPPLLADLRPTAAALAAPSARLDRLVQGLGDLSTVLGRTRARPAVLAEGLDRTFGALDHSRGALGHAVDETPALLATAGGLSRQRRALRSLTALVADLRPGVAAMRPRAAALADAMRAAPGGLHRFLPVPGDLARAGGELARAALDPRTGAGLSALTRTARALAPTAAALAPAQTTCNVLGLLVRNIASALADGSSTGNWLSAGIVVAPQGPDSEGSPSRAPADGPDRGNHLHADPLPHTAGPGEPRECEAGNEPFAAGRTVIGSPPGLQPATTERTRPARRGTR